MSLNKKNIDRLFQENLKEFEVVPDKLVWDKINNSLGAKNTKRRGVLWYWSITFNWCHY